MLTNDGGQEGEQSKDAEAPANDQAIQAWKDEFERFKKDQNRHWKRYYQDQTAKSRWDKITTVGVWVYTALTVGIVYFAHQQFTVTQGQGRAQLRPYLVVDVDDTTYPVTEGQPIYIGLTYKNIGNTPVYNGKLIPYGVVDENDFFAILPRNGPLKGGPECSGSDVGRTFGKETKYYAKSKFIINKSQVDLVNGNVAQLLFLGRYCYSDIFGEKNWIDTCVYWEGSASGIKAHECSDFFNQAVSDSGAIAQRATAWWPF